MQQVINSIWNNFCQSKESVNDPNSLQLINQVINDLDAGKLKICEKINNEWHLNEWIKKAISMYMYSQKAFTTQLKMQDGTFCNSFDKVPLKTQNWNQQDFENASFRMSAGAIVRKGAFIDKGVILMPSFVNIGASVLEGTMIDTWATVGSCAQIGKNCHISGGTGIGGVLEPPQAKPVIIEDNCFIGARSEVAEGVIVEEGSIIGMGVFLGQSTKIINRETQEVTFGRIPANSVVVAGSYPSKGLNIYCAVIVKQVDAKSLSKTQINDLLRNL